MQNSEAQEGGVGATKAKHTRAKHEGGGGGRSIGPYADSFPLSDHFQGGGGGGGSQEEGGGGRLHTLTEMA